MALIHPERVEQESLRTFKTIQETFDAIAVGFDGFLKVLESQEIRNMLFHKFYEGFESSQNSWDVVQRIAYFWKACLAKALKEYPECWSFTELTKNPKFQQLFNHELEFWKSIGHNDQYHYVTEIIMRHTTLSWIHHGRKSYQISPGLRWRLENTELRNYPADELRLPHSTIYIELPPIYPIVNDITGTHQSEGAYIVADHEASPRRWRVVLIGRDNENSRYKGDDALYHWNIRLREGTTVEECLQESHDAVDTSLPGADMDNYQKMLPTLKKLFKYLMNVVLYATMSDADSRIVQSDPEYQRLFDRAMKLDKKSKKRKSLLARARQLDSHPRTLLGGSIVVDRTHQAGEGSSEGSRGKMTVRTLVSGHWRNQPVGEGRKERKRIWIEPHWRGPEYAPITSKKYVLKSEES